MAPKGELVRLAKEAAAGPRERATATIDSTGTLPGRGAYVCRDEHGPQPKRECMRLATKKGTLQRALRAAVEVPAELVESEGR